MTNENHKPESRHNDIPIGIVLTVGAVSSLLLLLTIILAQTAYYAVFNAEFEQGFVSESYAELRSLKADQLEGLNSYRLIDPQQQTVQLPIDLAITRYVERHQQGLPQPSPE